MKILIDDILPMKSYKGISSESDRLKSDLIVSFEKAIEDGLSPFEALAIVLEWAADECARLTARGA